MIKLDLNDDLIRVNTDRKEEVKNCNDQYSLTKTGNAVIMKDVLTKDADGEDQNDQY